MNQRDIDDRRLNPGEEAVTGAPDAGERICPECGGGGTAADGRLCPMCEGLGRVIEGPGGG